MGWTLLYAVIAVSIALIILLSIVKRIVIFEYEKAIRYHNGRFQGLLGPGAYWIFPVWETVKKVDMRQTFMMIQGQEAISGDGVSIKISIAARYQIADPATAIHTVENYSQSLYTQIQLAVRELVTTTEVENIVNGRNELSAKLLDTCAPKAQELGLKLNSVDFKDVMFPGKLKETFAQVVSARKEGQAALERARGETAALRSLANAAKTIESNPGLMQLRLLQVIGSTSGNTYIMGMPPTQAMPIPIKTTGQETKDKPAGESAPEE